MPSPRWARRAHGYGWPLRPFDQPHAIRGWFGDPRFGAIARNFHFGIDIPAPAATPVYAVAAGTVFLEPDRVDVLTKTSRTQETGFSYWHIVPAVREHAAVHRHALLGFVKAVWGHLHFSELEHGRYVNPLRPGALTPSPPVLRPVIAGIAMAPTRQGAASRSGFSGRIAIVANVYARSAQPPPRPWRNARLAPTRVRWRIFHRQRPLSPWQTAVDFRAFIPENSQYHDIYAPGTRPNTPNRPGIYLYYLARDWNTAALPAGTYTIRVQAFGTHNTHTSATTTLRIANRRASTSASAKHPQGRSTAR